MPEGKWIQDIRRVVSTGELQQPFRRRDVTAAVGRELPGAFLAKHRIGNPDGETELFKQVERGLFRLAPDQQVRC